MSKVCYLFKGDEYIAYQYDAVVMCKVEDGYPRKIGQDWIGLAEAGFDKNIDAAEKLDNGSVYFFKGDKYLVYDLKSDKVSEAPALIAKKWPTFKEHGYDRDLDAVVNWGNGYVYFFKKDTYLRLALPNGQIQAPVAITKNWRGLFASGIQAAINWENGKAYFFKGAVYDRYDIRADAVESTHRENQIATYWVGTDKAGFASDIDAAILVDVEKKKHDANAPPPSTPEGNGTHDQPGKDTDKVRFDLPPHTRFGVTALVNSSARQTIEITVDGRIEATFEGAGTEDKKTGNLGTKVLDSGKNGVVYVAVKANGKACKLVSSTATLGPNGHIRTVGAEDGSDNDYNDSVVILNFPLD